MLALILGEFVRAQSHLRATQEHLLMRLHEIGTSTSWQTSVAEHTSL